MNLAGLCSAALVIDVDSYGCLGWLVSAGEEWENVTGGWVLPATV